MNNLLANYKSDQSCALFHIGVTRCWSGLAANPEARWQRTGKPAELSPKLVIEQPKQLGVIYRLHNPRGDPFQMITVLHRSCPATDYNVHIIQCRIVRCQIVRVPNRPTIH